ncbi:MAG: thioesterase family protein [Clostridia bacterium]|nr:thioesterase family protein [Clostridia bacterium]
MEPGLKRTNTLTVTERDCASQVGSGLLPVLATPVMAALMERTAAESVEPYLEEGMTTVGTRLELEHLAADPVGVTVTCESVLTEIDRRRLTFEITVRDGEEVVGRCRHDRFIVSKERFMEKAKEKAGRLKG